MATSLTHRALALTAALAVLGVRNVHAQTEGWEVCTPGALHSCLGLEIITSGVFSGSSRVGTNVSIRIHNLGGQYGLDNSIWSGLADVQFWGNGGGRGPSQSGWAAPSYTGGASGSVGSWLWQSQGNGNMLAQVDMNDHGTPEYLGGCAAPGLFALHGVFANTCSSPSWVTLSFTTADIYDAGNFQTVYVDVVGDAGNGTTQGICESNSRAFGPAPGYYANCEVIATANVTPEPVSIALMGTGLLGIGGFVRRRKGGKDAAA